MTAMTRVSLLRAAADVVDSMTNSEKRVGLKVQTARGTVASQILRQLSLDVSEPDGPFGGGSVRFELRDAHSALLQYLVHLGNSDIHHVKVAIGDDGLVTWLERGDAMFAEFAPHIAVDGARVLSVGCNTGGDLAALLDAGAAHVTGLDMIPELANFCAALLVLSADPARWRVLCGDFDTFECKERFDLVYHVGVLYHVESPMRSLRRAFELLRPGGTLALETEVLKEKRHGDQDYRSLLFWPLLEPEYVARGNNWPTWFIPSAHVVVKMLQCVGFEGVQCVESRIAKAAFVARRPE